MQQALQTILETYLRENVGYESFDDFIAGIESPEDLVEQMDAGALLEYFASLPWMACMESFDKISDEIHQSDKTRREWAQELNHVAE